MEKSSAQKFPLTKEQLTKGIRYFALWTLAGLAVLFYVTSTRETFVALFQLQLRYLVIAGILQSVDLFLGAWRNHILVQKFKPGISISLCLRAQLANEFAAAVTPGQSGGGPAWLYILYRGGIAIAPAVAISLTIFLTTLATFEIATLASGWVLNDLYAGQVFLQFVNAGLVLCTGIMLIVLLSMAVPGRVSAFIKGITGRCHTTRQTWKMRISRLGELISRALLDYQESCKHLFRQYPLSVMAAFLITLSYYFLKLNLAYVILLGLGIQLDYLTAMAILSLLRFILYFAPTPGGSGVGEISIAALMAPFMPIHLLPVYTLIYRALHLFLPAVIGAWILLNELRKETGESFADA